MRYCIDLRPAGSSHRGRGIGRYVQNLVVDLVDRLPPGVLALREERRWAVPHVRRVADGITSTLPPKPALRFDPYLARATRRMVERDRLAFAHITDPYLLHLAPRDTTLLATVYDLIQLEADGAAAERFRAGLDHARSRPGTQYLTISEQVRTEMIGIGLPADRITVVYPGATRWPAPIGGVSFSGAVVVGGLDPHKRPEHALAAAAHAGQDILFVGRHSKARIAEVGLSDQQLRAGASDAELAQIIRQAVAVVHASEAEGFGLPVLEAVTLATPVVAYDMPVTREIVGPDYPLVAADEGPDGLAAMLRRFEDPHERETAVSVAQAHAGHLTWEASQAALLGMYRHLLDEAPSA